MLVSATILIDQNQIKEKYKKGRQKYDQQLIPKIYKFDLWADWNSGSELGFELGLCTE